MDRIKITGNDLFKVKLLERQAPIVFAGAGQNEKERRRDFSSTEIDSITEKDAHRQTRKRRNRRPASSSCFDCCLLFRSGAVWAVQGRDLLTDHRILGCFVDIDLGPVSVVFGNISVGEYCFYRALGHAGIAINASISIDVETIGQFVKGLHWANGSAVGVLAINT
jgi:hypothetical protein